MALGKKKKKRILLGILTILVVAGAAGYIFVSMNRGPVLPVVETVALAKTDMRNAVTVTGVVESVNIKKVYSKLNYPVETLYVEVGDRVSEGDLLCQLDTATLETNIARQSASMSKSQQSASQSLSVARRNLDSFQSNMENDYSDTIRSAEDAVTARERALDTASTNYARARRELRDQREDREDLTDSDNDDTVDPDIRRAMDTEKDTEIAWENAKEDLRKAKESLDIAKRNAQRTLDESLKNYQSNVTSAEIGSDNRDAVIALADMESDLEKCTVASPVNGVVTAVYVTEGASPAGLMFVIEDTDDLKVKANIKEYDIGNISLGDYVEIKSDATGDDIYDGELTKIAPTSIKNAQGETNSGDTQFETEIAVKSRGTRLLIGMKARVAVVYEERGQVFSVSYDTLGTNENGEDIVFVARTDDTGATFAEAVVVQTGMESDYDIEIMSGELTEGDLLITSIDGIVPGMQVQVADSGISGAAGFQGPGGMGGPAVRVGG